MIRARTISIIDPAALDAADRLATAVLAACRRISTCAGRALPGLRAILRAS